MTLTLRGLEVRRMFGYVGALVWFVRQSPGARLVYQQNAMVREAALPLTDAIVNMQAAPRSAACNASEVCSRGGQNVSMVAFFSYRTSRSPNSVTLPSAVLITRASQDILYGGYSNLFNESWYFGEHHVDTACTKQLLQHGALGRLRRQRGIRRQRGGSGGGGLLDGVSPHEAGCGLRSAYLKAYMGSSKAEEAEELIGGPGVELWERLVGRLAARRAIQRAQLMLYWLQQELAFSEGCEDRLNWLSDVMVESDPDAPAELDWDFARCSRTLVALVVQMVDPSPAHAAISGRYPPQGERMQPKDAEDMMYWIRYEVRSYPLDWSVGILFEMAGLSEETQAVGRYHTEDIVLEVMRQLPEAVLLQVVLRMVLRLACYLMGSAKMYGVARQGSLAAMVTAFRYGSMLLGLVMAQKAAADMLHDELFTELLHLFRTPQVQERLREVMSGQDAMLGQATQTMFESLLQRIAECVPWERGAGVTGELGIGHVASRAGWRRMPALIT
ncbi:hypothetical protein HYH03_002070 [Edaphochlamys debaryana]|uniref:Uncharacterized protein n=1 Tax=Edaphochlamys debaryana TaxID=47281 RepID=A0A835YBT3_9CHLO|nr:hypothetical protein HYH03_002070 [Edaphochlamys debaryana]|eukprot:KAG2499773.1 hypothetical protein HYH03_002070 [Edaphochlamys debaryana]